MIVFVGACNLDIISRASETFNIKDSNIGNISYSHGGVMRNICHNVSMLMPKETVILSAVGDDNFGHEMINELSNICDTSNVIYSKKNSTSTFNAILDETNEMVCAINDMKILEEINIDYLRKNEESLKNAEGIFLDTNLEQETIDYIFDNYSNKVLCCDAVSMAKIHKLDKHINKLSIFKVNEYELEALIGKYSTKEEMIQKARKLDCRFLYITLGSNGAYLVTKDHDYFYKEKFETIASSIGLGDAFMSGCIVSYFKEFNGVDALRFSTKISYFTSLVVKANNLDLNYKEVMEELK